MDQTYDTIYLSPHLDDAVLSCGGQIFEQAQRGAAMLIVTIAAGEPQTEIRSLFAEFLHHNWGLTAAEAVAIRRAEDQAACMRLGAKALHWSLPDCIYRLHPEQQTPLYTSNEDIFGPVHPAEAPLIDSISRFLNELPSAQHIVAPLSAGNHVDHQLVRAAAERVWTTSLLYYEDYPYVQRHPEELGRLIKPASRWRSQLKPLSSLALQARIDATNAYRSQVKTLFNSADEMAAAITQQVIRAGGERLWEPVSADTDEE